MAIRKDEVLRQQQEQASSLIEKAEAFIDKKIRSDYRAGNPYAAVTVYFDEIQNLAAGDPKQPSAAVISALKKKFEEGGWTVRVEHGQRDGSYLQFS